MFFDLHNDFPTAISAEGYAKYAKVLSPDVTVTAVIWTSEFTDCAEKRVSEIINGLKSTECIKRFPIALEDIGFLCENNRFITFDFSRYLYCSLTWNFNNGFAGGALDDGKLTDVGKRAIEIIDKSGCAVDVAHLNKKSFYSVLDCAKHVICSHTGFNAHKRSLDSGQIRALVEHNSLIGLCTVTAFTDANSAEDFANVIDGFVQKYGEHRLAIGTDFNGSTDIPSEINDYNGIMRVGEILQKRGYDARTTEHIFFKNAYSFFTRRQT